MTDDLVIGGFGGPGGWDEGLRMLGISGLGIELDAAACRTRAAAGHRTIRADMAAFDVSRLADKTWGQVHSPPCTTFSAAGNRAGTVVLHLLEAGIRDMFAGRDTRVQRRSEIGRALLAADWIPALPVKRGRAARIVSAARMSALVVEPARFIAAGMPEWVTLEQVPEVLPLWKVYAEELRKLGYSVWCGKLNAADYGVPQTRIRAILIASRVRTVRRPEPTHYDPRKGMQLWGTPWVSMAEALGWGATGRPGPAVTAGGTATGGAEPFPTRARELLEAERDSGEWALRIDAQVNATCRPVHAPADTIKSGHSSGEMRWVLQRQRGAGMLERGGPRRDHPLDEPAPTINAGETGMPRFLWKFRNNNNNACERSLDEPAGTLFFGGRSNWAAWVQERPATTITTTRRSRDGGMVGRQLPKGEGEAVGGHGWDGESTSSKGGDSVRITVQEAAVLQSFRPDYPWAGSKTAQFSQVGNAVPPRLAMAVVGEATGIAWQALAAEFYGESEAAA